ncbi:flagellar hook-length control protein FliK [Sulfuritortus calidifontis]|uniref:Flagellar hook-length control protein FliK n=1 Tax=Sulfuritortus calidifontis TaxID=1914471 RepID=A0A4R3K135_9PROT|nr:flagellar hook-length control protein FliK [Sulfuritortus calidifontis]
MAEILAGPSVIAVPSAGSAQAANGKPAAGGADVFAGVLSGRVAALAQGETPAKGVSLAAFAGKSHLFGVPGLLAADKAAAVEGGTVDAALDPALLAALAGGMPIDPALLAMLGAKGKAVSAQVDAGAADVAVDGKELPVSVAQDKKALPAANAADVLTERLAADRPEAGDPAGRDAAKGLLLAQANVQSQVDAKIVDASLKAANVQVGGEALAATGQAVARSDELALAGVVQHKGASESLSQTVLSVRTPLQAANWAADFSQKVVWLVGRESQSAQMILNPPQLGAVEVRLTLTGSEAGAQFFSPHQGVREAIEAAIPRLRDMMAEAGLSLGQASVSPESFRDSRTQDRQSGGAGGSAEDDGGDVGMIANLPPARRVMGQGLVDLYV